MLKNARRYLLCAIFLLFSSVILLGCDSGEKKIELATKNFMDCVINLDVYSLDEQFEEDLSPFQRIDDGTGIYDFIKRKNKDITYEFSEIKIENDTATVSLKIKHPDAAYELFLVREETCKRIGGYNNIDMDAYKKECVKVFQERIDEEIPFKDVEMTFELINSNGTWKLSDVDNVQNLYNMVFCNITEIPVPDEVADDYLINVAPAE